METQVRTPQLVFTQPQRLIVPLFQRPYVWNEENQWEPLWKDIERVTLRLLENPEGHHFPHFLGAIVLQQVQNPTGSMQERTVIDGQQRLTTLQVLLDALYGEFLRFGVDQAATRVRTLVFNEEAFRERPEDQFKVWPTNKDRPAYNEVMGADPPVDYASLRQVSARIIKAHEYFAEQARLWLNADGEQGIRNRASTLERAVRELLQIVIIDLASDENAQEIFETLNARGAQLTAADLIKNFIFQRLMETGTDVEAVYDQYWKDFETGFWETEVASGRVRFARSAIFLNHWLIARTGEEIVAREVFSRFKSYADFDAELPMAVLVQQVHRAAVLYQALIETSSRASGPLDPVGLFMYRTGVLESEVVKPFVLFVLDPEQPAVPEDQLHKALSAVESWMVRRMLVRATTKAYNQVFAELVMQMKKSDRATIGDTVENYLRTQPGVARYWPDDDELRRELAGLLAYRRLRRPRLRMVLEAIEDHRRGWKGDQIALGGERVTRGQYAIEHVMPRGWEANWQHPGNELQELERNRLVHTLGNLTLLTGHLNSKVSNGPWIGTDGKRAGLEQHDVLFLNRDLLEIADDDWTDEKIRLRTNRLIDAIIAIWPVPKGHRSNFEGDVPHHSQPVEVADLLSAGMLEPGQLLYPRKHNPRGLTATVLSDGNLDVEGNVFTTPSAAAFSISGQHRTGWWYFLTDPESPAKTLRSLRRAYTEQRALEVDEEEDALDEDEDPL